MTVVRADGYHPVQMTPGPARRAAAFALLVTLAVGAWIVTPRLPVLDDGYISLNSAQSVLAGGDAHYGSPPLTGVTSPPYVLLLTVLLAAGMTPLIALRAALAMGVVTLVLALWALGGAVGLAGWRRFALPISTLAAGPVVQQATNGVETGWAMAVAVLLMAACLSRMPLAAAAAAGILPCLRPDLSPLAGLLLLAAIWREPWSVRLRAAGIAALVFLPWPLWLASQGGGWIPQTMTAKAAFFAESCLPAATKLATVWRNLSAWTLLFVPAILLAAAFVLRSAIGRLAVTASLVTIAAYAAVLPGGLSHNNYRYLYPVGVPWIALGLALALQNRERLWRATVLVVIATSLALWPRQSWNTATEASEREAVGEWVTAHLDRHARLLVHDAGSLAVFSDNPLVDVVGLKTPSSVAEHVRWTWPSCGRDRGKAVASIAQASHADYFVVATDWDYFFALTAGLRSAGFRVTQVRSRPVGEYGYKVYRIEAPDANSVKR